MAKKQHVTTTCLECGAKLAKKNGGYGIYYACPNWAKEWYRKPGKCKGIGFVSKENYNRALKMENGLPPVDVEPNKDQQAILDHFVKIIRTATTGHLLGIGADAGTGKSKTIAAFLSRQVPRTAKAIYLVFMSRNAKEMRENDDLAPWVDVSTLHALSNRLLPKTKGKPDAYAHYNWLIGTDDKPGVMHGFNSGAMAVIRITGMLKNLFLKPTLKNITQLLEDYELDLPSEKKCPLELILQYIPEVYYRASKIGWQEYDFNDMLADPVIHGMTYSKYDYIFIDEYQDLNQLQLEIVKRIAHEHSIVVCVGDPKQAIMGFAGALQSSMEDMIFKSDADLPLTITYRYGQAVLDHIKSYFPELQTITMAQYDNQFAGDIDALQFDSLIEKHENDGLMILCRNNAPLVAPALDLLRQGKKIKILGRDIAKSLIGTLLGYSEDDDQNVLQALARMDAKLGAMIEANARPDRVEYFRDKIQTLATFAETCTTTKEVIDRVNSIFTDNPQNGTIVFSTAHKSKGAEANVIMIIKPELFNLTGGFNTQEDNLWYVANTRAKSHNYVLRSVG